jgi:hypothetical protein
VISTIVCSRDSAVSTVKSISNDGYSDIYIFPKEVKKNGRHLEKLVHIPSPPITNHNLLPRRSFRRPRYTQGIADHAAAPGEPTPSVLGGRNDLDDAICGGGIDRESETIGDAVGERDGGVCYAGGRVVVWGGDPALGEDCFGVSGKVESEDVSFRKQTDWG